MEGANACVNRFARSNMYRNGGVEICPKCKEAVEAPPPPPNTGAGAVPAEGAGSSAGQSVPAAAGGPPVEMTVPTEATVASGTPGVPGGGTVTVTSNLPEPPPPPPPSQSKQVANMAFVSFVSLVMFAFSWKPKISGGACGRIVTKLPREHETAASCSHGRVDGVTVASRRVDAVGATSTSEIEGNSSLSHWHSYHPQTK